MATRGRNICNTLKAIRKQIADANGISYSPEECHFKGECKGTCPKCEQDVRDLEHELHLRQMAGKAIKVAGVALGITASATSCATQKGYYKSTPPKSEKVIPIQFQKYTTNDIALLQAKDSLSKKGMPFVQGHLISDEDNEPLIGASVIAKLSGKYAITDVNGNFTLEVEQGDTITVQYIGFIDRSIKLSEMSRDKLNIITLIFNESALGEVVAGIVPEVRIRGTAPVIKREDTFEEASFPGGSTALTQIHQDQPSISKRMSGRRANRQSHPWFHRQQGRKFEQHQGGEKSCPYPRRGSHPSTEKHAEMDSCQEKRKGGEITCHRSFHI